MTTTAIDRQPLPAPIHTGRSQATAIEQSRAVAEVQAAVVVAQQCPRNLTSAAAEMRESCRQRGLAERAFYRYPRGGTTVTGASVHLARELARCFGNIQYGLTELRRDDEARESEMMAWAWDVQTNTRASTTFIVPHKRDKTDKATKRNVIEDLEDLRSVYENNANNGARRVREMIFAVLPPWYVEEAKDLCSKTLASDGTGRTIQQRAADAVALFAGYGITVDQLEQKLGRDSGRWTEHDLAQLIVVYRAIQNGETTREEEFPAARLTAADLAPPPEPKPSPQGLPGAQPPARPPLNGAPPPQFQPGPTTGVM